MLLWFCCFKLFFRLTLHLCLLCSHNSNIFKCISWFLDSVKFIYNTIERERERENRLHRESVSVCECINDFNLVLFH